MLEGVVIRNKMTTGNNDWKIEICFGKDRKYGTIFEQRVYCKIRAQLGFLPTEIHADLEKVYGNGALEYATVCKVGKSGG